MARVPTVPVALLALALAGVSQSTDGLISGRVTDGLNGQPVAGALVTCRNPATNTIWTSATTSDGIYTLPLLPPGVYQIRVAHAAYQAKEQFEVQLGVAEALDLNFDLRRLEDIWESAMRGTVVLPAGGAILDFYGPDVDPNHWTAFSSNPGTAGKLEASLSDAVSPPDIRELPLNGQNIYAILLAEPGVAANNQSSRSLGIAANGQRTSSSNFLLDGLEANFYLVTGPLFSVAPDAIQEYRVSTNNFSAEYGRASGYVANAVTRSGGDEWHGTAHFDLENDVLNANEFQANLAGLPRTPLKQDRLGGFAGGPIRRNRLFWGGSVQYFRYRSRDQPAQYNLPNAEFLASPFANSLARQLLAGYPISNSTALDPYVAAVTLAEPVSLDQWLSLQRVDYVSPGGGQHAGVRVAWSNLSRPDFIWSPYPAYVSGLNQPVFSAGANWTSTLAPETFNYAAVGGGYQRVDWSRAHPEIPTLIASGGNPGAIPTLPGSPAAYGLSNANRSFEANDNLVLIRGKHILKFGGGVLWRRMDDSLGYGLSGSYYFPNIISFGFGQPEYFAASVSRQSPLSQPDLSRVYQSWQSFGFAQDTFRISPRLTLTFGLRYDDFGHPASVGAAGDWTVQWGQGGSFPARLASATLQPPSPGASVYGSSNHDFAPRLGFGYDLTASGRTLLRGGFGMFYDRIFDNLWLNARNNSFVVPFFTVSSAPAINYLSSIPSVLSSRAVQPFVSSFPYLTAFQPDLRNGYAEDFFVGMEQQIGSRWSFQANGAGSLGRSLIATDVINRQSSVNPALPQIDYLGNQGLSDYYSFNLVTRWRGSYGFVQAAYTWSHVIDNQSDPIGANDFGNLLFVVAPQPSNDAVAAFSKPYDSRGDRGNADFDQRQNLVFYSYWRVPASGPASFLRRILKDFTFSQIAAIRSGFPYSIYTAIADPQTINARARVLNPGQALLATPQGVPGGERIFDSSSFCPNDACPSAESARNAFAGPGLVSLDVAIGREFRLPRMGESRRLALRADLFNSLNHANLNPPGNLPNTPDYGIARFGTPQAAVNGTSLFGPAPQTSGFPALVPFGQTARQIQLTVRMTF